MNDANGYCRGCFRTLDEIARWSQMSDEERMRVIESLAKRRETAAEDVQARPQSGSVESSLLSQAKTMTELTVKLPDALAKEAAQAGLLTPEALARVLRAEIRRRSVGELFEAMDRMAGVPGDPMTEDEIQAEIDAARAARRAARGR